ncbi:MAG: formate dehydrogenase accessory sulfurtransferase FdhD [Acidobacteriota bacterium]
MSVNVTGDEKALPGVRTISVARFQNRSAAEGLDRVAVEEPLEIQLGFGADGARQHRSISVTMRTPGDDFDLAAGFLFTESVIGSPNDIQSIAYCGDPSRPGFGNTVRVELRPPVRFDPALLERHFYTNSSCGVCGKSSIEAVHAARTIARPASGPLHSSVIHTLPGAARQSQQIFESTGGLHASALFSADGQLVLLREDVGRHNALDKVIGSLLLENRLPLDGHILLVSGRVSFELVQKALMAGIPALAAVGAPSSLAIELARTYGMTLIGFVRDGRFNVYCGQERIVESR